MSSVPSEVLRDILLPLDRWTLDNVQLTNRRFLRLILERMSAVCLREIETVIFEPPKNISGTLQPKGKVSNIAEFVQALRSSRIELLELNRKCIKCTFENSADSPHA